MKAWCSRKMGSLAEPCTEDMEPFMKMCKALCMVLWPWIARPVCGSAKPAGQRCEGGGVSRQIKRKWEKFNYIYICKYKFSRADQEFGVLSNPSSVCARTLDGVSEAPVGESVHGLRLILSQAHDRFNIGCRRDSSHAVRVVIARVTQQRTLPRGVAQCLSAVVLLWLGADHLHTCTNTHAFNELLIRAYRPRPRSVGAKRLYDQVCSAGCVFQVWAWVSISKDIWEYA